MMDYLEFQTMIILIEGEYPPHERNTPGKMKNLIKKHFNADVSEDDILNYFGLGYEDYERINRGIDDYDNRYRGY